MNNNRKKFKKISNYSYYFYIKNNKYLFNFDKKIYFII